jgi:hypothetical protein
MFELVHESPWCCHYDVRDLLELSSLLHHIDSTCDHCYAQVQVLGCENLELFEDLICKFPGRRDDKCKHPIRVLGQFLEYRKGETGSLATACMGTADDIAAF